MWILIDLETPALGKILLMIGRWGVRAEQEESLNGLMCPLHTVVYTQPYGAIEDCSRSTAQHPKLKYTFSVDSQLDPGRLSLSTS